ncbi:MAG TPA: hotdog fold thioesterase [Acidimicrobiales bacterium]
MTAARVSGDATGPVEVWQEPARGGYPPDWFASLGGLERQQRFLEITLPPPCYHLCGVVPDRENDLTATTMTGLMPASEWLRWTDGEIPLGAQCVVADLAFGLSFGNSLPLGGGFTTAELSLTRLASPHIGGLLRAEGFQIGAEGPVGLTGASVRDADGRMVSAGTSRLAVFPTVPPGALPAVPDPLPTVVQPIYDSPDPWERPVVGSCLAPDVRHRCGGREIQQGIIDGSHPRPPLSMLTGLRPVSVRPGRATVVLPAHRWLSAPTGNVQGGFTAMLAEAALHTAVDTTTSVDELAVSLDVKVNYLRPVAPDDSLLSATAEVTHRGRSLAVAHATITSADGKSVALATGSSSIIRL